MTIPAWVDKATLCRETCLSDRTVDAWVRQGLLPPPRTRGGKLMWRWTDVDAYLDRGGKDAPASPETQQEAIRVATERRPMSAHIEPETFAAVSTPIWRARNLRHSRKAPEMAIDDIFSSPNSPRYSVPCMSTSSDLHSFRAFLDGLANRPGSQNNARVALKSFGTVGRGARPSALSNLHRHGGHRRRRWSQTLDRAPGLRRP